MTGFIAEVSSNHASNPDRALEFIDVSARIGCSAVKFQLFKIDQLFAPEVLDRSEEHRSRRKWELPVEFIPSLSARCDDVGIQFSCTPFYLDAVEELEPHVAFYKIASYELLWDHLLEACASTGKPVVLSTGMATLDEIRHAVEVLQTSGCDDLTLLHCVSAYPAPPEESNLSAMETLRAATGCKVGWSDHTRAPAVIHRAVHRWGADLVEFHLDLDGDGDEYRAGHCWLPSEIEPVIAQVETALRSDGSGEKTPTDAEMADRSWRADPEDGLRPLRHQRSGLD